MQCLPARYQSTVTPFDRGIVCSNGPCWSPDGRTFYFRPHLDAEGFVWSTSVYEGKLVRFAPDGTLDRTVGLPVRDERHTWRPQSRHRLRHLDGTRREGSPPTRAGSWGLFAVYGLGVRGTPEPRFWG